MKHSTIHPHLLSAFGGICAASARRLEYTALKYTYPQNHILAEPCCQDASSDTISLLVRGKLAPVDAAHVGVSQVREPGAVWGRFDHQASHAGRPGEVAVSNSANQPAASIESLATGAAHGARASSWRVDSDLVEIYCWPAALIRKVVESSDEREQLVERLEQMLVKTRQQWFDGPDSAPGADASKGAPATSATFDVSPHLQALRNGALGALREDELLALVRLMRPQSWTAGQAVELHAGIVFVTSGQLLHLEPPEAGEFIGDMTGGIAQYLFALRAGTPANTTRANSVAAGAGLRLTHKALAGLEQHHPDLLDALHNALKTESPRRRYSLKL